MWLINFKRTTGCTLWKFGSNWTLNVDFIAKSMFRIKVNWVGHVTKVVLSSKRSGYILGYKIRILSPFWTKLAQIVQLVVLLKLISHKKYLEYYVPTFGYKWCQKVVKNGSRMTKLTITQSFLVRFCFSWCQTSSTHWDESFGQK